jgi:hypothetical protein
LHPVPGDIGRVIIGYLCRQGMAACFLLIRVCFISLGVNC